MQQTHAATPEAGLEYLSECDLCGSRQAEPFLTTYDRNWPIHSNSPEVAAPRTPWSLVRCEGCGLVYLNPRPARSSLSRYYPQAYYAYHATAPPAANPLKRLVRRLVRRHPALWRLSQRTPLRDRFQDLATNLAGWVKPGRFLDVGCGAGEGLDGLADLGWETFGVDISEEAVQAARRKGHQVWLGDLTEVDMPEQSMDIVNMSHMLEHAPSPRRTLRSIRRVLRPGGLLKVEVPDLGSMWVTVFREHSWALDLPRHFYHFTRETLGRLATETGFQVREIGHRSSPRNILLSIVLTLRVREPINGGHDGIVPSRLLEEPVVKSLASFGRELEKLGQGNNLVLVAEVPQ